MKTKIKTRNGLCGLMSGLLLLLSLCLAGPAFAPAASAQDVPTSVAEPAASVMTGQSDYAPGSTATISGHGFQVGETITLQVLHADGTAATGADHEPWSVTADPLGGFNTTWHVCEDDCVGSQLKVAASGQSSGVAGQAIFTDSVAASLFAENFNSNTLGPNLVQLEGNPVDLSAGNLPIQNSGWGQPLGLVCHSRY